ncbi:acyl-CoA thioesterase [Geomonas sp. Red32]|uniref:acyl-CoA thioesterase n=1 Tax=Geomonas sp. Red32 TaxID=2912856 RepID=UPI00202CC17F|nr:acyl-CoA thioesterase [Geomonas sp. Red32]
MKEHNTEIELRFADLDAYGHVNSAVYFTYLETARVKLMGDEFLEATRNNVYLVVARAECEYKRPIVLFQKVMATLWLDRVGSSSFEIAYRLHDGQDTVYATARTTMVCIDKTSGAPVPVPESIRALA